MQEIILKEDGSAVLRDISERPCAVVDHIVNAMSENAARTVKNVGLVDKIPFHIIRTAKETYAVMVLPFLTINAPYEVGKDGLLRPNFNDTEGKNPSIPLKWPAQPGMTLLFAARIYPYGGLVETKFKEACYLLALNSVFQSFKLPLPNLYDTGYMCMGEFNGRSNNIQQALEAAYNQLHQSKWNSDLNHNQAVANKMIVFKPVGDTFEPQACPNWATMLSRCESAGIELLKGVLKP